MASCLAGPGQRREGRGLPLWAGAGRVARGLGSGLGSHGGRR